MSKKNVIMLLLCSQLFLFKTFAAPPIPPEQPMFGPGGSDYDHKKMVTIGPIWPEGLKYNNNYKYYIFAPKRPIKQEAPVILFLHGWQMVHPIVYLNWIEHIVKKGYVVVWAQYQLMFTLPNRFEPNAIVSWKDALKRMNEDEFFFRPERDENGVVKTAFVGHSLGGYLSALIASRANKKNSTIPKPMALVIVEPGGYNIVPEKQPFSINPDTKVVIVAGDEDDVVCTSTAVSIWNNIDNVEEHNKDFLLVVSDNHGVPKQIADHQFPASNPSYKWSRDARDFYITYKLSVAAFDCRFKNLHCEYALGNGSDEQINMGVWSDGVPMEKIIWLDDPNGITTICNDP